MPDALERASDDAEVTQALAGLVLVDGYLQALAHHVGRDPVRLGQRPNLRQLRQRRPVERGARGMAVRGVVRHLGVVTGDAVRGGEDRVKDRRLIDVAIGQLANGGDGL